jgi:hypothetical protein
MSSAFGVDVFAEVERLSGDARDTMARLAARLEPDESWHVQELEVFAQTVERAGAELVALFLPEIRARLDRLAELTADYGSWSAYGSAPVAAPGGSELAAPGSVPPFSVPPSVFDQEDGVEGGPLVPGGLR